MIIRWVGDRVHADRATVAELYGVSERSVRRHCPVVSRAGRVALVDALDAEQRLGQVHPRPGSHAYAAVRRAQASHPKIEKLAHAHEVAAKQAEKAAESTPGALFDDDSKDAGAKSAPASRTVESKTAR